MNCQICGAGDRGVFLASSRLRILQACGSLSWGGLEMQALTVSLELRKRGHDVTLLCREKSTLLNEAGRRGIPARGSIFSDSLIFGTIGTVSRWLRNNPMDVIHTHLSHDLWWLVPAVRLSNTSPALFLTKHVASGVKKDDFLHTYLYRRLDGVFAVSNYIKTSVFNTCPVDEANVHVIPPGISLQDFGNLRNDPCRVRSEFNIPMDAIVVGMIGRLSPGKGHEEILQAAKMLSVSSRMDIRFLVVGGASFGEESYEKKIKDLAAELGLGDRVIFTGFRQDVPRLLACMDIFAFPSHEESFGLALTEAMAMGIPVVATRSAGVLDIVEENRSGILVSPKNQTQLAEGILRLAVNPEIRQEYGIEGRRRVKKLFSIESVVDRLEVYYEKSRKGRKKM